MIVWVEKQAIARALRGWVESDEGWGGIGFVGVLRCAQDDGKNLRAKGSKNHE